MSRISEFLATRRGFLKDYGAALSGSAGRLIFSLAYFVALANTLPIAEFGVFAAASAAGVVISRLLAFGFVSPLYRISTVKPQLVGAYMGGFIIFAFLSLPLVALAAVAMHALFFAHEVPLFLFGTIVFGEVVLWRTAEVIIIINNGMGRFGRAAMLVISGTAMRALAALAFTLAGMGSLADWAWFYLAANGAALVLAIAIFYPGQRIRFAPAVYYRRLADSVAVSGAEILFYVQMELDKLLVLSIGGAPLAGIYAIIMRLVDLTAIPIRAFTMMLVQAIMRQPVLIDRLLVRAGIESGIFLLSTVALLSLAGVLHVFPRLLGDNVAEAVPVLAFALLVPAFRNLVEYQSELLYARGQTVIRAINLALLAGAKAVLLWAVLSAVTESGSILYWLNGVFAALYLISTALTYSAMRMRSKSL